MTFPIPSSLSRIPDAATLRPVLRRAYRLMRRRFGHQHWWPGDTPFEICVGAILTQNTSWRNVERAIAALKRARAFSPRRMHALAPDELAALIRPAGYFNVKARRLRSFVAVLMDEFGGRLDRLFAGPTARVRDRLLAVNGIGPETADSMLLYAGNHQVFVIDAYTRRVFARHGWHRPDATYDELQALCTHAYRGGASDRELDRFQDCHAQWVVIGKDFCRPRTPRCAECPLLSLLPQAGPHAV
jgi:endonuclease-3 related protein